MAALIAAVAVAPSPSSADKLQVRSRMALRTKPSGRGRVVARVPARKVVEVIEVRGSWVQVRAGKRTGWLPRRALEPIDDSSDWIELDGNVGPSRDANPHKGLVGKSLAVAVATPQRARPGEAAKSVQTLAAGTRVSVLQVRGRWLQVKARGRAGWIPAAATLSAERGGERGPARGDTDGAHSDRAPGAATDGRSAEWRDQQGIAVDGTRKAIDRPRRSASRVRARADSGAAGELAARAQGDAESNQVAVPAPTPAHWLRADARLGVSSVGMSYSSNGGGALSGYRIAADAAAVTAGLQSGIRISRRFAVVIDGAYNLSLGAPGLRAPEGAESVRPTGFAMHDFDAGAHLAAYVGSTIGLSVGLRAGYHYGWFDVSDLDNPILMAREALSGPTVGMRVDAPWISNGTIGLGASVDVLVGGQRQQTPGLEDGARVDALAAWAGLKGAYRYSDSVTLEAAYRFSWASSSWSGDATRLPGVTEAVRTDDIHSLTFGVGVTL